jgi:hypothetical protein
MLYGMKNPVPLVCQAENQHKAALRVRFLYDFKPDILHRTENRNNEGKRIFSLQIKEVAK